MARRMDVLRGDECACGVASCHACRVAGHSAAAARVPQVGIVLLLQYTWIPVVLHLLLLRVLLIKYIRKRCGSTCAGGWGMTLTWRALRGGRYAENQLAAADARIFAFRWRRNDGWCGPSGVRAPCVVSRWYVWHGVRDSGACAEVDKEHARVLKLVGPAVRLRGAVAAAPLCALPACTSGFRGACV